MFFLLATSWWGVGIQISNAAAPIDELLPLIPSSANAVSVIRVRELIQSPRGQREGWAKSGEAKLLAGVEHLPLTVPLVVRAAHLVPDDQQRGWSLSLFPWPKDSSMTQLARQEGGEVDMIGGTATVNTARNGYFVRVRPETLGVISPADRQDVARWIRFAKSNTQPVLSESLRASLESSAQIVLAFDMEEMLEPKFVKAHLGASRIMSKRTAEVPAFAEWLSGIQGVRFLAKVEDKTNVEVRFDFAANVGSRGETFQRLLVEFLNERGAILDELPDADLLVEGKSLTLKTSLSDESLRRVMTLLSSPPPATVSSETDSTAQPAYPDTAATVRYYSAIMQLLDDLEKLNRRASDYLKTAVWHENFAKKIEQLPVRGVDDDLSRFGSSVAHHLRALAASLRGVPLKVNTLERTITYQTRLAPYSLTYDYWFGYRYVPQPGFVWTASNLAKVREQQAAAITAGAEERNQAWNLLLGERNEIRQKMTNRYPTAIEKNAK